MSALVVSTDDLASERQSEARLPLNAHPTQGKRVMAGPPELQLQRSADSDIDDDPFAGYVMPNPWLVGLDDPLQYEDEFEYHQGDYLPFDLGNTSMGDSFELSRVPWLCDTRQAASAPTHRTTELARTGESAIPAAMLSTAQLPQLRPKTQPADGSDERSIDDNDVNDDPFARTRLHYPDGYRMVPRAPPPRKPPAIPLVRPYLTKAPPADGKPTAGRAPASSVPTPVNLPFGAMHLSVPLSESAGPNNSWLAAMASQPMHAVAPHGTGATTGPSYSLGSSVDDSEDDPFAGYVPPQLVLDDAEAPPFLLGNGWAQAPLEAQETESSVLESERAFEQMQEQAAAELAQRDSEGFKVEPVTPRRSQAGESAWFDATGFASAETGVSGLEAAGYAAQGIAAAIMLEAPVEPEAVYATAAANHVDAPEANHVDAPEANHLDAPEAEAAVVKADLRASEAEMVPQGPAAASMTEPAVQEAQAAPKTEESALRAEERALEIDVGKWAEAPTDSALFGSGVDGDVPGEVERVNEPRTEPASLPFALEITSPHTASDPQQGFGHGATVRGSDVMVIAPGSSPPHGGCDAYTAGHPALQPAAAAGPAPLPVSCQEKEILHTSNVANDDMGALDGADTCCTLSSLRSSSEAVSARSFELAAARADSAGVVAATASRADVAASPAAAVAATAACSAEEAEATGAEVGELDGATSALSTVLPKQLSTLSKTNSVYNDVDVGADVVESRPHEANGLVPVGICAGILNEMAGPLPADETRTDVAIAAVVHAAVMAVAAVVEVMADEDAPSAASGKVVAVVDSAQCNSWRIGNVPEPGQRGQEANAAAEHSTSAEQPDGAADGAAVVETCAGSAGGARHAVAVSPAGQAVASEPPVKAEAVEGHDMAAASDEAFSAPHDNVLAPGLTDAKEASCTPSANLAICMPQTAVYAAGKEAEAPSAPAPASRTSSAAALLPSADAVRKPLTDEMGADLVCITPGAPAPSPRPGVLPEGNTLTAANATRGRTHTALAAVEQLKIGPKDAAPVRPLPTPMKTASTFITGANHITPLAHVKAGGGTPAWPVASDWWSDSDAGSATADVAVVVHHDNPSAAALASGAAAALAAPSSERCTSIGFGDPSSSSTASASWSSNRSRRASASTQVSRQSVSFGGSACAAAKALNDASAWGHREEVQTPNHPAALPVGTSPAWPSAAAQPQCCRGPSLASGEVMATDGDGGGSGNGKSRRRRTAPQSHSAAVGAPPPTSSVASVSVATDMVSASLLPLTSMADSKTVKLDVERRKPSGTPWHREADGLLASQPINNSADVPPAALPHLEHNRIPPQSGVRRLMPASTIAATPCCAHAAFLSTGTTAAGRPQATAGGLIHRWGSSGGGASGEDEQTAWLASPERWLHHLSGSASQPPSQWLKSASRRLSSASGYSGGTNSTSTRRPSYDPTTTDSELPLALSQASSSSHTGRAGSSAPGERHANGLPSRRRVGPLPGMPLLNDLARRYPVRQAPAGGPQLALVSGQLYVSDRVKNAILVGASVERLPGVVKHVAMQAKTGSVGKRAPRGLVSQSSYGPSTTDAAALSSVGAGGGSDDGGGGSVSFLKRRRAEKAARALLTVKLQQHQSAPVGLVGTCGSGGSGSYEPGSASSLKVDWVVGARPDASNPLGLLMYDSAHKHQQQPPHHNRHKALVPAPVKLGGDKSAGADVYAGAGGAVQHAAERQPSKERSLDAVYMKGPNEGLSGPVEQVPRAFRHHPLGKPGGWTSSTPHVPPASPYPTVTFPLPHLLPSRRRTEGCVGMVDRLTATAQSILASQPQPSQSQLPPGSPAAS